MMDIRWSVNDTFDTAIAKAPFSQLIRLALTAGVAIRERVRGGTSHEPLDGFAGHAMS